VKLKGRVALIAGASRNVGRATALRFAQEGADLALVARETGKDLEAVAEECRAFGVRALPLLADVSDHEHVNKMVAEALKAFGKIDILFNSVAIRPKGTIQELTYEEFDRVIKLDVHAAFYLCKAIVPGMIERGSGSIIMMGGLATYQTSDQSSTAHIAGKHGLAGFVKALAREVGRYGIRANVINVSSLDTERTHREWYPDPGGKPQWNPENLKQSALGRPGRPEEIANVALFLASDDASYVTGGAVLASGGRGI
jgi:NAD(P)-dependent dehydrogenase (short-subunit alcohol dehydrogenase family)